MRKWKIVITETLTRTVETEADAENKDAAVNIGRAEYQRRILYTSDHAGGPSAV